MPAVVLISGRGSNLEAIQRASENGHLAVTIRAVISSKPGAAGLDKARRYGIPALTVPADGDPDRRAYDQRLMRTVDEFAPQLVVLAGFMRLLTPGFVRRYAGRILNIHPSLLPRHRGLHTHRRVLEAGERIHGASVHFVTESLDGGPVIAQARVEVRPGDDEDSLAQRVLAREHILYPRVIGWFAAGRLEMRDGAAWLDGKRLVEPVTIDSDARPA